MTFAIEKLNTFTIGLVKLSLEILKYVGSFFFKNNKLYEQGISSFWLKICQEQGMRKSQSHSNYNIGRHLFKLENVKNKTIPY